MKDKTRIFKGKYTKKDFIDTIKKSVKVMKKKYDKEQKKKLKGELK